MELWVAVLIFAGTIALVLLEGLTVGGVGGWLDARASQTRAEVLADIAQYGPDGPGIRTELLEPDERQMVLEARRQRRNRFTWHRHRPA